MSRNGTQIDKSPGSINPLSGHWKSHSNVKDLYYGSGCVQQHLLNSFPSSSSKAYIITGTSLVTQTPVIKDLETLLGSRHAGTIPYIRQHGPVADVDRAISTILSHPSVDVLISVGGGSPIDTAKVISYRAKESRGTFLTHFAIPTTLSAAECTAGGGYTKPDGVKVGFRDPGMAVSTIFYDPLFARHTPRTLWLSSGMRALDHAVECMYHPTSSQVPWKALALWAMQELFESLPEAARTHPDDEGTMMRLMLAAFASSGLKGENLPGGMGLSHSLGHALGSPYGIAHGLTSCMTLGKVVKLKANESAYAAGQIARLLPAIGVSRTGDDVRDAVNVGDRIEKLVIALDITVGSLRSHGVEIEQRETIVQRALGGVTAGAEYERVLDLVKTLF